MLKNQLEHFYNSLILFGMGQSKKPKSWLEAFLLLELYLQKIDNGSRQLIFFDELPWLDTPKFGFITAFEAFWNNFACHRSNIMVIVCGSANSWILDNLINNHGGLYNRVTYEIKLYSFTLQECEEYYKSNNIIFSRFDIIGSYMALGVSGVYSINSAWQIKDDSNGMQVDLIIVRNDNVINMCEIKFYAKDFIVTKEYYKTILGRQDILAELVSRKYSIRNTLITTFGLFKNEYSGIFTNVITIDDLFK